MTKPTLEEQIEHQQGIYTGTGGAYEFSKLQSLRELAAIKSQPVPVEPDELTHYRKYPASDYMNFAPFVQKIIKYIDALKLALQAAQQEQDAAIDLADRRVHEAEQVLQIGQQRAEKAESRNKRLVELLTEPSNRMFDALTDRMWKDHTASTVWKAMSAELLREVDNGT